MDDDWGNSSLTPSEGSSSSLFEHVESQKKRTSVKADWLELRNHLFQSRAETEREEERLERERREHEAELALQQQEVAAQAYAAERARLDALDDGSDIPPWHRSSDRELKPTWLIELLVKTAQKEDADEVYLQYKNWPVKQELEGIKQAYEEMDNSQKKYKTPHALPPRRETQVFREGILLKQQEGMGESGDEMEEVIVEEIVVEYEEEEEEEIVEEEEEEEILEEEEEIVDEEIFEEEEEEIFLEETVHFIEETVHVVEEEEEEICEDSDDEDSFYEEEEVLEMSSSGSYDETEASDLTSHNESSSDSNSIASPPASPIAPNPAAPKKVLSPLEMLEQMNKPKIPTPTKKAVSRKSTRKSTSKRKSTKTKKPSRPSYRWEAHSEKKPPKQSTTSGEEGKAKLKKKKSPTKVPSSIQPSKLDFSKTPSPQKVSKTVAPKTAPAKAKWAQQKQTPNTTSPEQPQKSSPVKPKWAPKQTSNTAAAQGGSSTVKSNLAKWQKPAVTRDQLRSSIVKTKLESKPPLKKSPVPVTKDELRSSIVQTKLKNKPVLRKPSFLVSSKELKTNVVQEKLVNKPKWKKPAVSVTKDELKRSSVHEKLVNKPKWKRPSVSVTKDELKNSSVHSKLKNKSALKRPSFSPTKVELKSSKPQTKLEKKTPVKKPAVAVTKDQLKSSKVQEKLSNRPALRKSSFSVSSKELQASVVKDKLENKPKWRRPSVSVTKDELKGSKVQTKLSNRPILRKPSFSVSTKDLRGSIVQDKLAKKPDITKISSPVNNVKLVSMKNKLKKTPLPPLAPKPSASAALPSNQEKPKWMEKARAKDTAASERNSNSEATVKPKNESDPEEKPSWAKKKKNTTTNESKRDSEAVKPKADSQAPWTKLKLKPSTSVPNMKGSGKQGDSKLSVAKDRLQGNKDQTKSTSNWKSPTVTASSAKSNQERPNWMQQRTLVLQKSDQSATTANPKGKDEPKVRTKKSSQAENKLRRSSISVPNLKGATARKRNSLTHTPSKFANAKDWLKSTKEQAKVTTKPDLKATKPEDKVKTKRRSSLTLDLLGPSSAVSSANSSYSSLNGDDKPAWVERALALQQTSRSRDSDEDAQ